MEVKEISEETLTKMKTLPKIKFSAFQELINKGQVIRLVKLKHPKTIFFDEETEMFVYLNKYHGALCKCGKFKND